MSGFHRLAAAGCLLLVLPTLQVQAQPAPSTIGASIGVPALDGAFNQLQQAATTLTGTAAALATGAADATAAAVGAALGPASAPLEAAPAPRPAPPVNVTSNIAFAVTAMSATFGPNNTLFMQDISPAVTYFATVPVYHAGNLNTTSFLNLTNNGSWLGNPDAALMGRMNGQKVVVLLSIGGPTLKGRTAIFKAYLLGPTATPLLKGGPVAAFLSDQALAPANNPTFLSSVNGKTVLTDVSLVVDSAMVQVPVDGLKSQQASVSASNDGFTYDCSANTPWKPIYCGSFGGFYGGGYYGGFYG